MDKKYQIFISSTYKDLKPARKKVMEAILSMGHFPVGMEMFGASNDEQWRIIKDTIDTSDYYIVIMGKCFGSIVPNEDISYTQKEFRYAGEKKIPIIAFIIDDNARTARTYKETDPERIEKLNAFRSELEDGRTADYWKNADDLSTKVVLSLTKEMKKHPRPGWIRNDEIPETIVEEQEKELSFDAELLLLYISEDKRNKLSMVRSGYMQSISTAGYNFVYDMKPRTHTRWVGVVHELIEAGFIESYGSRGGVYSITNNGYLMVDRLKAKYPDIDTKKKPTTYLKKSMEDL